MKVVRSTFAIALFSYSVLDKVGTVKDFQRYVSSQKIQKIRADKEPMILKNDYSVSFLFTPQFSKEGKAHHIVLFRFRTEQREEQLKNHLVVRIISHTYNVFAPVMISKISLFHKLHLSAKASCFVACSRSSLSSAFFLLWQSWYMTLQFIKNSCTVQFRHLMWPCISACRSKSNPLDPLVVENWRTWWRSIVRKTSAFADEMKGKLSVVCLLF